MEIIIHLTTVKTSRTKALYPPTHQKHQFDVSRGNMNMDASPKQAIQVVFTRKSKQIDHPKIYFNDIEVKTVNDHKHLGLIHDSKLSFISHIPSITNPYYHRFDR